MSGEDRSLKLTDMVDSALSNETERPLKSNMYEEELIQQLLRLLRQIKSHVIILGA
jgi:hypothetical protein